MNGRFERNEGTGLCPPVPSIVNRRGLGIVLAVVSAISVTTVGLPSAQAFGPIGPGDDVWATPCGGGAYADFSVVPIPADYFGPGSQAFFGNIMLGGDPNGITIVPQPGSDVDTVVHRDGALGLVCGGSETVPIEIVALNLVSCSPIQVDFGGGNTEMWDVQVCLQPPQAQGTMTINHECNEGGSYTSTLPVQVQLIFSRGGVPGPNAPITQTVTMNSFGWWTHDWPFFPQLEHLLPGTTITDCKGVQHISENAAVADFFPGLWSTDCLTCGGPPAKFEKPQLTPEQALLAAHGLYPSNAEKQSGVNGGIVFTEACCLQDGSCMDVPALDCGSLFGGVPQGAGTNCANTSCQQTPFCPLPPDQFCQPLQQTDCDVVSPNTNCLPTIIQFNTAGVGEPVLCDCIVPGTSCGPITINGDVYSCEENCPTPPGGMCQIVLDGVPTGSNSITGIPALGGHIIECGGCGGGGQICPLENADPAIDLCGPLQTLQCQNGLVNDLCLATSVSVDPLTLELRADACACEGGDCGPVHAVNVPGTPFYDLFCDPNCPAGVQGICQIILNGNPTGATGVFSGSLMPGDTVTCDCQLPPTPVCPLENVGNPADLCASLQGTQCLGGAAPDTCSPSGIVVDALTGALRATACSCDSSNCGPIHATPIAGSTDYTLSCDPNCPAGVAGICQLIINGTATGNTTMNSANLALGDSVICDCQDSPPAGCPVPDPPVVAWCDTAALLAGCDTGTAAQTCLPAAVSVFPGGFTVDDCSCYDSDPGCGPVEINGDILSCQGPCLMGPTDICQVFANGVATGFTAISVNNPQWAGAQITCDCDPTPAPKGACCDSLSGLCMEVVQTQCPGTWLGPNTTCGGIEACCFGNGTCTEMDRACCLLQNGSPQGAGSACTDTGPQACCTIDAAGLPTCIDADPLCCQNELFGTPGGLGTTCQPEGACCQDSNGDGVFDVCEVLAQDCCELLGGDFKGAGTNCDDNNGNMIADICEQLISCPLENLNQPALDLCASFQDTDCIGDPADTCLPILVFKDAAGQMQAEGCTCGDGTCGPVHATPIPGTTDYTLSCDSVCPPGELGFCQIFRNGLPTGQTSIDSAILNAGDSVLCRCDEQQPVCPLGNDLCTDLQSTDCVSGNPGDLCLPTHAQFIGGQVVATSCACLDPTIDKCGPVEVVGALIVCPGGCPAPNPPTQCELFIDDVGQGSPQFPISMLQGGEQLRCECPPEVQSCPLPAAEVLSCATRQPFDCDLTDPNTQCRPKQIRIVAAKQIRLTIKKGPGDVIVPGVGTFPGDTICLVGEDPAVDVTEQTRIDNFFADMGPVDMTFQFGGPEILDFGCPNPGCGPGRECVSPQQCLFDGIPNLALGMAQLELTGPNCNLRVGNLGSSGKDGVRQDPLPQGSTEMITCFDQPNFSLSMAGSSASIEMYGDVPGGLISVMSIVNFDDNNMRVTADVSPLAVPKYKIEIINGNNPPVIIGDLGQAVVEFAKDDIQFGDCKIVSHKKPVVDMCDCFPPTPGCGPIVATSIAGSKDFILSCPGPCPIGQFGTCQVFVNGVPKGQNRKVSQLPVGAIVTCDCGLVQGPKAENFLQVACMDDTDCLNQAYCIPNDGGGFPGTCYVPKLRAVSIDASSLDIGDTALRVSVQTGGPPVVLGWIGAPVATVTLENAMMSFMAAAPIFRDWSGDGTVHLSDCHVSPGRVYLIQSTHDGVEFSAPLALRTNQPWGDAIRNSVSLPPQGVANLVDAQEMVKGFQDTNVAPKVWLDIHPVAINRIVNLADAQQAVKGFQGDTFFDMPAALDPCECAGLAPCP